MRHDHFLQNIETYDRDRYERAIAESGFDISIRDQKYDANHNLRDEPGCSLWCAMGEGDLSRFWVLV